MVSFLVIGSIYKFTILLKWTKKIIFYLTSQKEVFLPEIAVHKTCLITFEVTVLAILPTTTADVTVTLSQVGILYIRRSSEVVKGVGTHCVSSIFIINQCK